MDSVANFNSELSSLYENKPPISKAKMASITRSAMKAIKFYKHVVQSVEKFIQKCKPEYKVPGLYVIDSIVRQSRHQFGPDKDVFAPRFAQNMQQTFSNLFRCAPEDKGKIIRVLNLWLKNNVFSPEVINPLFDFFNPSRPQPPDLNGSGNQTDSPQMISQDEPNHSGNLNQLDSNTIRQLQQLKQILIRQTGSDSANQANSGGNNQQSEAGKFNKSVLDFDYGDDDDDDVQVQKPPPPPAQNNNNNPPSILEGNNLTQLLQDPNVLRQLQNLQKLNQQEMDEQQHTKLTEMRIQEEAFEKHLVKVLNKLPFANECDLKNQPHLDLPGQVQNPADNSTLDPEVEFVSASGKVEIINLDGNDSRTPTPDRDRYKRRRSSRSRSRDRRRGGRRSRSRSRSPRSPRSSRRRSSRDRSDRNNREKEKLDKEKENERERRRKGLPDLKKEHLSVCSTTLWVGHLSKLVHQEELSDTFGKYGDIISIDMIIPRGCAFIAMNRRQDAYKAMNSLRNHKMQGRAITISWATGKGVKSKEWKDYWDLDLGVSYIPWNKIAPDTDFEALEEGGMFDEASMPEWLKNQLQQKQNKGLKKEATDGLFDTSQPPPGAPHSLIPGVPLVAPPFGVPPRIIAPPLGLPMGIPLGVPPPPPHQMMMPLAGLAGLDGSGSAKNPPGASSADFLQLTQAYQMPPAMSQMKPNNRSSSSNGDDHMDIDNDDDNGPSSEDLLANQSKMVQSLVSGQLLNEQLLALTNLLNRPPPLMQGAGGGAGNPIPPLMHSGIPPLMGGDAEGMMGGRRGDRDQSRGRDDRDFDGKRWGNMGRDSRNSKDRDDFPRRGRGGNFPMFPDRRDNGADDRLNAGTNNMMMGGRGNDAFERRGDDFRGDDFDRRGGRDFHGNNRFGPPGFRGMPHRGGGGFGGRGGMFNRGGPRGGFFPDDRGGRMGRDMPDNRRPGGRDRRGDDRAGGGRGGSRFGGNSRFENRERRQGGGGSRWSSGGGQSPSRENDKDNDRQNGGENGEKVENAENLSPEDRMLDSFEEENNGQGKPTGEDDFGGRNDEPEGGDGGGGGIVEDMNSNTTPLYDEPAEPPQAKEIDNDSLSNNQTQEGA